MQTKVHGRHGDETAFAVHDAVVVGQGEGSCAAERVACDECYRGEGKVDEGGQEWEETFGVGVGVLVGFVEFEALYVDSRLDIAFICFQNS